MVLPKLAVFDVDGTVLDWGGTCSPRTIAAAQRLREAGVVVALATGRPKSLIPSTIESTFEVDWAVSGNGGTTVNMTTLQVLRDVLLPADVVRDVVQSARQRLPGIGFALELKHQFFEEPGFADRVPPAPHQTAVTDVLARLSSESGDPRKLIAFHPDFDADLDGLAAIVGLGLDDRFEVQYSGLPIVEIAPCGDDKSVALQQLIDHLGIEKESVIAFGDGRNDIGMLSWAGVGVAMGNAHPHTVAAADVQTAAVDAGGVAVYIDQLFINHESETI